MASSPAERSTRFDRDEKASDPPRRNERTPSEERTSYGRRRRGDNTYNGTKRSRSRSPGRATEMRQRSPLRGRRGDSPTEYSSGRYGPDEHSRDGARGRGRNDRTMSNNRPEHGSGAKPTAAAATSPTSKPSGSRTNAEAVETKAEAVQTKGSILSALENESQEDVSAQMMAIMGFDRFKSTKNTKVPGNDKNYGARIDKKPKYRQYMNRPGGFNRPLSPS